MLRRCASAGTWGLVSPSNVARKMEPTKKLNLQYIGERTSCIERKGSGGNEKQ